MELYIKHLPYAAQADDIRAPFANFGRVVNARQIMGRGGVGDIREEGTPTGYGFVEMPSDQESRNAIEALNRKLIFLSNLPPAADRQNLEEAFREYLPMIKHMVNLGNMEAQGGDRFRTPVLSPNNIGYLIFSDEKVAQSFMEQHCRPTGRRPIIHGREVSIWLAFVEEAKPKSR